MNSLVTARDVAILLDLYNYRYLSFSQLARLHFPSHASAYQRLRTLKREGLVKTFHAPAMQSRYSISIQRAQNLLRRNWIQRSKSYHGTGIVRLPKITTTFATSSLLMIFAFS